MKVRARESDEHPAMSFYKDGWTQTQTIKMSTCTDETMCVVECLWTAFDSDFHGTRRSKETFGRSEQGHGER